MSGCPLASGHPDTLTPKNPFDKTGPEVPTKLLEIELVARSLSAWTMRDGYICLTYRQAVIELFLPLYNYLTVRRGIILGLIRTL